MAAKLRQLVSLKLTPKTDPAHQELFDRFALLGYPTLLFLDSTGNEVDRLSRFYSPQDFLAEVARIESGDTFGACLERLDAEPGDAALLERAVHGLIERGDLDAAYLRIDAFKQASPDLAPDPSEPLRFETMTFEHGWLYYRATKQFRNEWEEIPDVSNSRAIPRLVELLAADPASMEHDEQAASLRQARQGDAEAILAQLPPGLDHEAMFSAAGFAFDNGFYERAAELYEGWFGAAGDEAEAWMLNSAAWNMFLARTSLDTAVEIARAAVAKDDAPHVTDTLAQLLYASGHADEAIELEAGAVARLEGDDAADYQAILDTMRAGGELAGSPSFETYPES